MTSNTEKPWYIFEWERRAMSDPDSEWLPILPALLIPGASLVLWLAYVCLAGSR